MSEELYITVLYIDFFLVNNNLLNSCRTGNQELHGEYTRRDIR